MSVVPSRRVSSGYYRVHLYVVFGLHVLAATLHFLDSSLTPLWVPLTSAALAFVGTVVWFARWHRLGVFLLWAIAGISLWGAWEGIATSKIEMSTGAAGIATTEASNSKTPTAWIAWADCATGGLVLGTTVAAMLLGHWYLNSPGMQISPLRRLCLLIGLAVLLRAAISGYGTWEVWQSKAGLAQVDWLFIALRWLSGIAGVAVVAWMSWKTLDIPNTQSATGILYVAVILAFIGELTAQLMGSRFDAVL
ncbi:MAG: hypothetical protein MPJ50_13220 [Pirellulales bacterium]|nr:hypothetical protein [Pirellulales bacterium]